MDEKLMSNTPTLSVLLTAHWAAMELDNYFRNPEKFYKTGSAQGHASPLKRAGTGESGFAGPDSPTLSVSRHGTLSPLRTFLYANVPSLELAHRIEALERQLVASLQELINLKYGDGYGQE